MRNKKVLYLILFAAVLLVLIIRYPAYSDNPIRSYCLALKRNDYTALYSIPGLNIEFRDERFPDHLLGLDSFGSYEEDYLRDKYYVSLYYNKGKMFINAHYQPDEDADFLFNFTYILDKNELTYEPLKVNDYSISTNGTEVAEEERIREYMKEKNISEDDIRAMQEYVIRDVIMQSWLSRKGANEELRAEDYKNLNIEDHTFDFEE